jgi:hypothetical protein
VPDGAAKPSAPAAKPAVKSDSIFSKASIEKAVAKSIAKTSPAFAPAPQAKKSFWKTPWPYVIIAGVAAVVLIKGIGVGGGASSNDGYF